MLRYLEIREFALIEQLDVEFDRGLNLLTGETGSGKSIIVDALGLLLGAKGSVEMIRSGSEKATVTGVFELDTDDGLKNRLQESGIEFNPDELVLKRELLASGKGRAFANNQVVPVGFLKELALHLVDIHGQHEQQTLAQGESQLAFVDAFAGEDELLSEVRRLYETWRATAARIERLRMDEQERLRQIDLLRFQIGEIQRANLKGPDEDDELASEHVLLANADKLFQLSTQAYAEIYDAESSATAAIKRASRQLEELCRVDPRCHTLLEQLNTARISLDDVALSLREYSSKIDTDPRRLEWTELRQAEIDRLKRKYGKTVQEVLAFYETAKADLENLVEAHAGSAALEKDLQAIARNYGGKAEELSAKRKVAARSLERIVEKELAQLAMDRCRFQIEFAPASFSLSEEVGMPKGGVSASGIDQIEFLLSPNSGEDLKPLVKIASGGEISRIMLALKNVKAVDVRTKTLVFDEVDAGIGGQTADVVGLKLKRLSKTNQVICVTHLPQIASYADSHYCISKTVQKGRTVTRLNRLDGKQRIHEIARMISGERKTDSVLKHAAELLKSAAK